MSIDSSVRIHSRGKPAFSTVSGETLCNPLPFKPWWYSTPPCMLIHRRPPGGWIWPWHNASTAWSRRKREEEEASGPNSTQLRSIQFSIRPHHLLFPMSPRKETKIGGKKPRAWRYNRNNRSNGIHHCSESDHPSDRIVPGSPVASERCVFSFPPAPGNRFSPLSF